MFAAGLPTSNLLTSALSQTVAGLAGHASAALKGFDADLDSGNVSGAQSFLSALQQKVNARGQAPAGGAISGEFAQVNQDLQSGDLVSARADFASLKSSLAHLNQPGSSTAAPLSSADPTSSLASLQSLNLLQQSAYNSALHLTLPTSMPSLSVSSW